MWQLLTFMREKKSYKDIADQNKIWTTLQAVRPWLQINALSLSPPPSPNISNLLPPIFSNYQFWSDHDLR